MHPSIDCQPYSDKYAGPACRRRSSGGFTLVEILLALAIIGLIASLVMSGANQVLNDKPTTPNEVFWQAVEEARKLALKSERNAVLTWANETEKDGEGKSFVVTNGVDTARYPVPFAGDLEVSFLQPKQGNTIMIAGTVVETSEVKAVVFYTDGTCMPFRAQFLQSGAIRVESIDQWTCAPVLAAKDPNAPPGGMP